MGIHLLRSLVLNDFKHNKVINSTLFLFLLISVLLMATGAVVIEWLPGFKANKISDQAVREKAHQLMMKLGIHDVKHHTINKVSGGQLQREEETLNWLVARGF